MTTIPKPPYRNVSEAYTVTRALGALLDDLMPVAVDDLRDLGLNIADVVIRGHGLPVDDQDPEHRTRRLLAHSIAERMMLNDDVLVLPLNEDDDQDARDAFTRQMVEASEPADLDGATTVPGFGIAASTAGEFAAKWNRLNPGKREAWFADISAKLHVAADAMNRQEARR